MTLLGSVDIPFTKSTKIAVDATDTAGQAATVAQQATDTAGQAQATAQTASQTATQAAATAADAAQAAQTAITTANGKNKAYYGATTPANPQSGDIWFVEDDNNNVTAIKHYDGTQWITDVDNTALEQQISAAQEAADNAATVGQAAQQTAEEAEAKGDAAAKAAEEAKDAATKAQSDASSAVTSANNAVNTANKATQDAQDAIDKAQEGFDTAQDALSKADAAVDTANNAKQVASDAATQASTANTNAQTAMSNAQDAINKANDANANANTREKSIIKSDAAPSNPATDQLWVDTSKTPQIMRRWDGSSWVDLSPTQASQIGAVSTTTYTTDITNINNTLSQKASVTTVNTLSGRVDNAETAITQNANAIASKADKTAVDTLKNTVDNHSTLISQNADAIALKASQSTVDALTGRVSTAEATLKTQADQIAARITKTDADAKYATQTALTATANSLTSNISAVQTNLDNLQIGGANLAPNSTGDLGTDGWRAFNGSTNLVVSDGYQGHKSVSVTVPASNGAIYTPFGNVEGSKQYTMSFWVKSDKDCTVSHLPKFIDANNVETNPLSGSSVNLIANTWTKVEYTFIAPSSAVKAATTPRIGSGTFPTNLFVSRYKLEKGAKATDWTPAAEDMATVIQFNTLSQTLDSTVSRIGNAEGNISALQQTSDSFATRISNAEGNISSLTQTTNGLQTTVSGKVDKTTYNSFVTQTNTALQSKLSVQDAASTYATQSSLTQTANSLTSQITSVQTNLNNLQIGGRNLVPNSTGLLLNPDGKTAQSWQEGTISHANNDGTNSLEVQNSGTSESTRSGTVFNVEPNTTYVFRVRIKGSTNSTTMDVYFLGSKTDKTGIGGSYDYVHTLATGTTNKNDWQEYITKFTTNSDEICGYIRIDNNASSDGNISSVYFSQIKVEKGTKATDWSPAPEDMATQSQITQLANDINLRIKQNDVINQINISTEGILIDGKKVHITGQTTIDNAVIKDAMIQSMTANKLTAGTIDANVITVKNINASNIVTGTLDASKATVTNIDASKITTGTLNAARIAAGSIDASKLNVSSLSALSANLGSVTAGNISGVNINIGNGNFTVDTAGNLVAKNANITGAINATSGTFSGSVNVISTVTNPWGNYDTVKINPTYRFPIHIDDDESRHTYLSSGIIEIYYPAFSDINAPSAKTTIEPNLITFSENDSVVSQITANAIYSIDYYNGQSTISSNGNAQFGNISFNGAHSIISKDGGQLYFTNSGGSRVDISASNGNFDQRVNPNNMRIGYHTFEVSDGSALYFTDSSGNYSYSPKAKSWATSSKFEWKQDFQAIKPQDMLEIIKKTNVVQFKYKADVQAGRDDLYTGFVIGGGYQTPDEFLNYDRDGIDTYKVTGVLTGAVQELSARDESNKERLSIIEEQNKNLLLKIADLEARLAKLEA